ncbi:hypothetical protein [Longirhabdus pacifica]|uniref:hypothetical protein n=1 Tax=Longirhabdus pacifica TaxID=2305227 RepID=UPI003521A281
MFAKIMPDVMSIMLLVGLSLSVFTPSFLSSVIGEQSGWIGVVTSTIIGSIALIPSFIVFPLGDTLVENGAGLPQVAAFMSSLMAVGIFTLPLERKTFGNSFAYARNAAAIFMCLLFSLLIWVVMV